MKHILTLILFCSILSSCKVYKETYILKQYPIEWYEELVIQGEHLHIQDCDNEWKCLYYETDTICWHHTDTINIYTLVKVEKVKRSSMR